IMAVRSRLSAVRDEEAAGRAMLSRWIGEVAERPLASEQFPICRPADKQRALASLADHPLLEVARRRTTVAERSIEVARADRDLDFGWSVTYGDRGGGRSDVIGLEISIPLPLNRSRLQNRRITEASSLAAAARDRLEDTRREITANFEQAWAQWSGANAQLDTTISGTLPALQGAEEAYQARVAGGQPALGEVLAASERVTRTVLETIEQRADLARTSADLLFYLEECTT
ncbi:MAG TPA: TolC family protein, partial [Chloroflexota bacterium]|nr:TolC family protein [Chloroflexota bacterium]